MPDNQKKKKKKQGTGGTKPIRTLRSNKEQIDSILRDDEDIFELLDKEQKKLHKKN